MTMISSYYAQVGVGIDKSSLNSVSAYLGKIEKQMMSFQKRIGKAGYIDIKVRVDRTKATLALQRSLNGISRASALNIGKINISAPQMTKALNQALNKPGSATRIRMGALLSQSSLQDMRNQIRASINSLVVSPRINPRVSPGRSNPSSNNRAGRGSGGSSLNPRSGRMSPWHNPMMVGGGLGAFMRYGVFSLPFIAGTMGLNALSNKAATLQSQQMMMNASIGDKGVALEQAKFLSNLGDRLGKRTETMTPFYAQMFAGARGTELESALPEGFTSLMEYSSVMGLNEESMKGSIRAISQMISKRSVTSEELKI